MATKKTSTKKTAAKPAATPPVVPAVVMELRVFGKELLSVTGVPETLLNARIKLAASLDRLANRVAANLAGAGKVAEKEAAKAKREAAKKDKDVVKRNKKLAVRDALKAKLDAMEKELAS